MLYGNVINNFILYVQLPEKMRLTSLLYPTTTETMMMTTMDSLKVIRKTTTRTTRTIKESIVHPPVRRVI